MSLDFSSRLKKCRKKNKLTQQQLAEIVQNKSGLALSRISIARYETGQREPEISILIALANALSVTPNYLLGISNEETYDLSNDKLDRFYMSMQKYIKVTSEDNNIDIFLDQLNNITNNPPIFLDSKNFIELFSLLCNAFSSNIIYPVDGNLEILTAHLNKMINESDTLKVRDFIQNSIGTMKITYNIDSSGDFTDSSIATDAFGRAMVDIISKFYTENPDDPVPDNIKPLVNHLLSNKTHS